MQPRIIDGKYEIVRELSKGGMGAVFEARHLLTRRKVALKLILAETLVRKRPEDALRRFEREARAAGSIESRHVVSVLDTGIDAATSDHYIVMELLLGEDLRQLVRRAGKLPPNLVLSIARQVCVGLRRAHEQGIVHRDIKAGNIYLARRDDGHIEVKILDFGIAKLRVDPLAAKDGHDLRAAARWSVRRSICPPSKRRVRARSMHAPTSGRSESSCTRRSPAKLLMLSVRSVP